VVAVPRAERLTRLSSRPLPRNTGSGGPECTGKHTIAPPLPRSDTAVAAVPADPWLLILDFWYSGQGRLLIITCTKDLICILEFLGIDLRK
jgi:hypothetical protein